MEHSNLSEGLIYPNDCFFELKDSCLRNIDALLTLQNYFISSRTDVLRERVLHVVSNIYRYNKLNVWLVYEVDEQFLLRFVDELQNMAVPLQQLFIGLIVFLATENNFVPYKELERFV